MTNTPHHNTTQVKTKHVARIHNRDFAPVVYAFSVYQTWILLRLRLRTLRAVSRVISSPIAVSMLLSREMRMMPGVSCETRKRSKDARNSDKRLAKREREERKEEGKIRGNRHFSSISHKVSSDSNNLCDDSTSLWSSRIFLEYLLPAP
jgi:hypothetical protein